MPVMADKLKRIPLTPEQVLARRCNADFVAFKEKHETVYFKLDATDKTKVEQWLAVCAQVVRQRDADGYWYPTEAPVRAPRPPPVDPTAPLSKQQEQITALRSWNGDARYFRDQIEAWALLEKARAGDRMAAAELVYLRQNHEYEGFEMHAFSRV